jgi:sulfate adenylyltransferase
MTSRVSGCVVLFTGLPAAGKSTLAASVHEQLERAGARGVVVLDGDALRREISADLGYTRADREEHMRRVGARASDVAAGGGIALCSLIAPYDAARTSMRAFVERTAAFILVHVATPVATCEARDPKGLYARARVGALPHFTGVSDPYEIPADADVTIDTTALAPAAAAARVVEHLRARGII